tara:strand:- start:181 stop:345 length:165 start_codon:yes stop_codon:yes gene_type:complete
MLNTNNIIKVKKQIHLKELARLTLLNILSVQGVIYTHYKNKQLNKGKKWKQIKY